MGHNEILRQRAKAMAALGKRFDLADFDDAAVPTAGVPLSLLSSAIDAYIAGPRADQVSRFGSTMMCLMRLRSQV